MSHFMTIKLKVLDDVTVPMTRLALKKLDKKYDIEPASKHPRLPNFGGFNTVVMYNGEPTTIRMNFRQKENGKLELVIGGEFYRTETNAKEFANKLSRCYSETKIEQHAKAQNMIPVKKTVKENGDVVLRFRVAG